MNKEQKAWIEELRTTNKMQGGFVLKERKGKRDFYCCLGIVREMYGSWKDKNDKTATCLSDELTAQLGLRDPLGSLNKPYDLNGIRFYSLAMMNDKGFNFKEIANYIERQSENVFVS